MSDSTILDKNYQLVENIVIRKINNDTTLAYNKGTGDMYEFDEITEDILSKMKEQWSLKEIYSDLCEQYDADEEEILDDYIALVARLVDCKVILLI